MSFRKPSLGEVFKREYISIGVPGCSHCDQTCIFLVCSNSTGADGLRQREAVNSINPFFCQAFATVQNKRPADRTVDLGKGQPQGHIMKGENKKHQTVQP